MTFFEYMQQQIKRDDPVGDLAGDMSLDSRLFPSEKLPNYSIDQWRARLKLKGWGNPAVIVTFETAVKEFESL